MTRYIVWDNASGLRWNRPATQQEIDEWRSQGFHDSAGITAVPESQAKAAPLAFEALEAAVLYCSDTLSGRADGPEDREWFRAGFVELRSRLRAALAAAEGKEVPA